MAHVADWKIKEVDDLAEILGSRPVVGLVKIEGIPSAQFQIMRANLRDRMTIRVSKNQLILRAIEKAGGDVKGLAQLLDHLEGQTGIITTDLNPFKLNKVLGQTKTRMTAKGGETAPEDIIIKKGDTPFPPGPIVGELQQVGIPAAIDQGKVTIKKTVTVVEKGEIISPELAAALSRLEIEPLEVGLILRAAYEDGLIFTSDVLTIDDAAFLGDLQRAGASAYNLAMNTTYITPVTVLPLLAKARAEAMNLALNAGVITPDTVKVLLSKARGEMLSLASRIPDALPDELKATISSSAPAAAPAAEQKEEASSADEEEEEEEEVSEEEAAAGLGALFG